MLRNLNLIGPGKVYNYWGEGTTTLPREIAKNEKNIKHHLVVVYGNQLILT